MVDTLWFATGGGKTETYLLYVLTAAFHDRLRGKTEGITSWGRFPLRMLSLQQTQRFADVLVAADLVRRDEKIRGAFSLGFMVGNNGTPNRIPTQPRAHEPDYRSRGHARSLPGPAALPVLRVATSSPWPSTRLGGLSITSAKPLRAARAAVRSRSASSTRRYTDLLPTVVIGTLDKAASVSMQAAMRGFYGAPAGRCTVPTHGFTYAPRSRNPNGCLFPGCTATPGPLAQDPSLYAPTVRMQDELHLLRDSLGAVDSHYEALLDDLQAHYRSYPKIIASSATLAGQEGQIRALYRRDGRSFPLPGPRAGRSLWSRETDILARRFAGTGASRCDPGVRD